MIKSAIVKRSWLLKTLVFILGFLCIGLVAYLVFLPIYPLVKYQLIQSANLANQSGQATSSSLYLALMRRPPASLSPRLTAELVKSANRVIIKKIGVDVPIVEAPEAKLKTALSQGAWRLPQSSTPDQGGNTVISAHRYKYLPPNNLTFYLLDKLAAGDVVKVIWKNKEYDYRVKGSNIVPPTAINILNPTDRPTLTLFTCDPIWSEKNRLVVIAELLL